MEGDLEIYRTKGWCGGWGNALNHSTLQCLLGKKGWSSFRAKAAFGHASGRLPPLWIPIDRNVNVEERAPDGRTRRLTNASVKVLVKVW